MKRNNILTEASLHGETESIQDEHDRPARHAVKAELRGDNLIQIEVIAVL